MRSKMHRIIGNLHHLLSIGTYDDFMEAAKIPGTPKHIKAAFEALARERMNTGDDDEEIELTEALTFDRDNHEEENKVHEQKMAEAGVGAAGEGEGEQFIYEIMMNSGKLNNRREIAAFARGFKIKLQLRPDDSRSFAARKLAKAIQASPKEVQSLALSALFTGNLTPPAVDFKAFE